MSLDEIRIELERLPAPDEAFGLHCSVDLSDEAHIYDIAIFGDDGEEIDLETRIDLLSKHRRMLLEMAEEIAMDEGLIDHADGSWDSWYPVRPGR